MMIKRLFDLSSAIFTSFCFIPLVVLVALTIKMTSKGSILYWSDRVGVNNRLFKMPKFRTMKMDTPVVATHELSNPESVLTPIGGFLRKTSLDELPQLWSILKGDMSFVGPRPALFNQDDLVALRTEKGIERLLPGLTGWAQINGRDELSIPKKVSLEVEYLEKRSFSFDLKIIALTALKVIQRDSISH